MNAAEFRITREYLGLTTEWLARHFGVNLRSVSRWEAGSHPVPKKIAEQMTGLESYTEGFVRASIRKHKPFDSTHVWLTTPRTDAGMLALGDQPFPASWHRAATARIREGLRVAPGGPFEVVIIYAEDDAEIVNAELVDG